MEHYHEGSMFNTNPGRAATGGNNHAGPAAGSTSTAAIAPGLIPMKHCHEGSMFNTNETWS